MRIHYTDSNHGSIKYYADMHNSLLKLQSYWCFTCAPGGGYFHILTIRVCAAREGMVFKPFDLVEGTVFKAFGLV